MSEGKWRDLPNGDKEQVSVRPVRRSIVSPPFGWRACVGYVLIAVVMAVAWVTDDFSWWMSMGGWVVTMVGMELLRLDVTGVRAQLTVTCVKCGKAGKYRWRGPFDWTRARAEYLIERDFESHRCVTRDGR